MKRRFISQPHMLKEYVPIQIPEQLKGYADELRLLYEVPLTYLFSDLSDISDESIRFFNLDINWTDALLDGAFSIGRVCAQDCVSDQYTLKAARKSTSYQETPRMKHMHPNHKKGLLRSMQKAGPENTEEDYQLISGFVLRSQLVRRMKGLRVYGYDKSGAPKSNMDDGAPLTILRMDTIGDDLLLCLFHGEVYEIIIAEPKTGLRFGASSVDLCKKDSDVKLSRSIDLRSALDSPELGQRIETFCIDKFTADNGRLSAKKLADAMEAELKSHGQLGTDKMTPSRFAFELIAAAHRADFRAGKEAEHGR